MLDWHLGRVIGLAIDSVSVGLDGGERRLAALARRQLEDYDRREPGSAFAEGLTLSLEEAYGVQGQVAALRVDRGERVIGYKVGCTSTAIRRRFDIDHSVFGRLFDGERWPSAERLSLGRFCHPAIEGELAVRLKRELRADVPPAELLESVVDAVFPVIEWHHLVFRRQPPGADELVANNAIHAGFVSGDRRGHGDGLSRLEADWAFAISIDGQQVATVGGGPAMDTVESSLRWLAAELPTYGLRATAGQTILCGAVADLIPLDRSCDVRVESRAFGNVECAVVR